MRFYNCAGCELIAKFIGVAIRMMCFQHMVLAFFSDRIGGVVSVKWIINVIVSPARFKMRKFLSPVVCNELASTKARNFDRLFNVQTEVT